jgi:hypothetical protein
MRNYRTVRRTPMNELSVAECGMLEIEYAMQCVREVANDVRMKPWLTSDRMRYPIGFFHGVRFAILAALSWGSTDYEEFDELTERYASEAEFLSTEYLGIRRA